MKIALDVMGGDNAPSSNNDFESSMLINTGSVKASGTSSVN